MDEKVVMHHSCGFVIFAEVDGVRKYLLLKYPEGHIDFVKGHIENEDENELETAKRELLEETGIAEVEVVKGYLNVMNYDYFREGLKHVKKVDYFLGKVEFQEISVSDEHLDFIWCDYEKSLQTVTYDNARDILISAEAFLTVF